MILCSIPTGECYCPVHMFDKCMAGVVNHFMYAYQFVTLTSEL